MKLFSLEPQYQRKRRPTTLIITIPCISRKEAVNVRAITKELYDEYEIEGKFELKEDK